MNKDSGRRWLVAVGLVALAVLTAPRRTPAGSPTFFTGEARPDSPPCPPGTTTHRFGAVFVCAPGPAL